MATGPTLAGFLNFVRQNMGIKPAYLPDNSVWLSMSLSIALGIVNRSLRAVSIPQADGAGVALNPLEPGTAVCTMYDYAVYLLAADNLINFAQDQEGFEFFKSMRAELKVNDFISGVVQSSGDEGTNVSMVVQKAAEDFTLANLQQLKTPWGRQYLAIAQSYGPTTWGLTGGGAP